MSVLVCAAFCRSTKLHHLVWRLISEFVRKCLSITIRLIPSRAYNYGPLIARSVEETYSFLFLTWLLSDHLAC
ncbi:hypothetical protein Plhal304r1_c035g0109691 [Plasmopara halstedii]